ncbi:MAG: hypothetical protein ACLP6W_06735, partial [Bryobacteraceae bacterium]
GPAIRHAATNMVAPVYRIMILSFFSVWTQRAELVWAEPASTRPARSGDFTFLRLFDARRK